ncbi:MAG TPA: DUF5317 family protein [Clostridia bacterium]|nr:DUF5317 family protein [Clostridia bacterium]
MLLEAAIAGIAAGLLLKGSLRCLLDCKLRFFPLLLASVLLSLLPKMPGINILLSRFGAPAAFALAVLRYGALLAFVFFNRGKTGLPIVGAGGFLNALVTIANGGKMPVSQAAVAAAPAGKDTILLQQGEILNYCIAGARTRLAFLCDCIKLRGIFLYFLSFGDILIAVGIFLFLLAEMKPRILTGKPPFGNSRGNIENGK